MAGALFTLVAFVLVERRVADPLFPPSMTRRRPVWTVLLATSVAAGSLSAVGVVMHGRQPGSAGVPRARVARLAYGIYELPVTW
ncbi:hypothetical protein ACFZDJ_45985 [Streptomyces sp. NPDC007896]|uniref:hypothetical protein n=1 Tax=unclassified Streptomyces TaxID=2593676 RepID=UPI0036E0A2DB